jgi:metal-dependent HD superfamily phosphatase/phosphodiesterase
MRQKGVSLGVSTLTKRRKKKEERLAHNALVKNTFHDIAMEWHSSKVKKWSAGYASDILEAFNKDVFPYIGKKPIADIKPLYP